MFAILARRWEPGQRIDWHNVTGGRALQWYLDRGFKVCDGTGGTPNLIDQFVKYQDEANEGSTGGAKTVTPSGNVSVQGRTLSRDHLPSIPKLDQMQPTSGASNSVITIPENGWSIGIQVDGHSISGTYGPRFKNILIGGNQSHDHGGSFSGDSQDNEPQHVCCVPLIYLPGA